MAKDFQLEQSADAKKTPKRVAFIKPRIRARVTKEETEMEMTVPHLVVREIIAFEVLVIVLAIISLVFDAPLEWMANPVHTPNPAKAPWYFLGLQELLHYFPPVVGGVILPGLVVVALIVIPYFKINWKREGMWKDNRRATLAMTSIVIAFVSVLLVIYQVWAMLIPTILLGVLMIMPYFVTEKNRFIAFLGSRPLSWWIMTWFVTVAVVLTIIGTLFRGPGWAWTWPWEGIY